MLVENISDFVAKIPKECRLLGLDVGDKTIGLALSDASRTIASPLVTIERKKLKNDIQTLQAISEQHHIGGLVIGNPINMDGSFGARVQSTRSFIANIAKHIALPMVLWDERMSTMAVERIMIEADLTRQRRAQLVDKLAACYILQGAIDRIKTI